jgi:exo-beta-1,3-glucanase (GH17 family)
MKSLTAFVAAAALLAGISAASAQMSPSGGSSMSKSANATGSGKFCIETSKGGSLQCKYASITACQKDAQPQGLRCSPNPKSGTTGAK